MTSKLEKALSLKHRVLIEDNLQRINNLNLSFPMRTFNLSLTDVYYINSNVDEIVSVLVRANDMYLSSNLDRRIDGKLKNQNLDTKESWWEKLSKTNYLFVPYYKILKQKTEQVFEEYANNFQIAWYLNGKGI